MDKAPEIWNWPERPDRIQLINADARFIPIVVIPITIPFFVGNQLAQIAKPQLQEKALMNVTIHTSDTAYIAMFTELP